MLGQSCRRTNAVGRYDHHVHPGAAHGCKRKRKDCGQISQVRVSFFAIIFANCKLYFSKVIINVKRIINNEQLKKIKKKIRLRKFSTNNPIGYVQFKKIPVKRPHWARLQIKNLL